MKKILPIILLFLCCNAALRLSAQAVNVITNPTVPDIFTWAGTGGALSGYAGTPIIFNNSLVLEYNPTGTSDLTAVQLQLAVYTGGSTLQLIPNPDAGQGVYFESVQLIFNNKLFFIYLNAAGIQQLASFDGTSITLYPNPDASVNGYVGSPRIFNGSLYVAYVNVNGVTQFGKFTGSGISLIPNPDASTQGFYFDYSVVFDGKLCSRYITAAGPKQLATFDGTSWTLLPNPDATTRGVIPAFPVNYKNKLYFIYYSATNQYQFMQYDGTNNPTLVANPVDASSNNGGVSGFPIVYNDTLFYQYYNTSNILQLGKFDGTTMSLVPNPDATTYGFYNTPIVYNNNLYIFYVTPDGLHHIGEYEAASNSLKVYPNPDGGSGYWDQPVVYDNNLCFIYYNAQGLSQLGYFDGNTIKLIANPSGIYNSGNGNNGYVGQPIIWNNLLYMQYASVPYGNAGNLASFDGSSLPVKLVSFTAQAAGSSSFLTWQTANEIDNAYFEVERSADSKSFTGIGKVQGHGNADFNEKYVFTDNSPLNGVNYYRLKQVDVNGNYSYSGILSVDFEGATALFKAFPNPAVNSVNITLPSVAGTSVIQIFDMNGKEMMEETISANTNTHSLDVSKLSAGAYQMILIQGGEKQTMKLVKQ
jgi:hypothetical protein